LVDGGWTPEQARDLAACIVADRHGLAIPAPVPSQGDMPEMDVTALVRLVGAGAGAVFGLGVVVEGLPLGQPSRL
jgi:hypothetical protein